MTFSGKPARLLAALALAALIGLPAIARAQGPQAEAAQQPPPPAVVHASRTASNGFDWMAQTNRGATTRVTLVRAIGRGSYICAPAGFGRKSRCYAN
jgi:hypothetical protein